MELPASRNPSLSRPPPNHGFLSPRYTRVLDDTVASIHFSCPISKPAVSEFQLQHSLLGGSFAVKTLLIC